MRTSGANGARELWRALAVIAAGVCRPLRGPSSQVAPPAHTSHNAAGREARGAHQKIDSSLDGGLALFYSQLRRQPALRVAAGGQFAALKYQAVQQRRMLSSLRQHVHHRQLPLHAGAIPALLLTPAFPATRPANS